MPLDPQAGALLDQMRSMGAPPLHTLSVPDARQLMENLRELAGPAEDVAHVEDHTVPGPDGDMPVRLYRPAAATPPAPIPPVSRSAATARAAT